jgi:hypothetical protein
MAEGMTSEPGLGARLRGFLGGMHAVVLLGVRVLGLWLLYAACLSVESLFNTAISAIQIEPGYQWATFQGMNGIWMLTRIVVCAAAGVLVVWKSSKLAAWLVPAAVRKCVHCGHPVAESSRVCTECGGVQAGA